MITMIPAAISRDKNPGAASSNTRITIEINIPTRSILVPFFVPNNVSNLFFQELFAVEIPDPFLCFFWYI